MKNLYLLHSNPEQLFGFDQVNYRVPEIAYELASEKPELRKKLEPYIMRDPWAAVDYAKKFKPWFEGWPKAEPYIMKNPHTAYQYAYHVIQEPWKEAEPTIMKNPLSAYLYARNVLERPWPEAEPYIMKDSRWWEAYTKFKAKFK